MGQMRRLQGDIDSVKLLNHQIGAIELTSLAKDPAEWIAR
jgi:hypothetical protein